MPVRGQVLQSAIGFDLFGLGLDGNSFVDLLRSADSHIPDGFHGVSSVGVSNYISMHYNRQHFISNQKRETAKVSDQVSDL